MNDEYYMSASVMLALLLSQLFAILYRRYVRSNRRQRRREVQQPENLYIALSRLIEYIERWTQDHPGLPLNHPDIQISVNRVVGITGYILETCEHVPNASHLRKWHDDLLPFVGVEGQQKESG